MLSRSIQTKKYSFYAEITKGYILKVIVDSLTGPLQRGFFSIEKDGIKLRQMDQGQTILYDIDLPRKNFKPYMCINNFVISLNLKHMQGLLKNVKKKDSIVIFITKDNPGKFSIEIKPEGGRMNSRIETNSIVCQRELTYEFQDLPEGEYNYPMVIEATDFQKIKRLTTAAKIINITMQRDNYLSFECDAGVIYDSTLRFGELTRDKEGGRNRRCYCDLSEDECECVCNKKNLLCLCPSTKGCGEYIEECECICEECENYIEDCDCKLRKEDCPNYFEAKYYSTMIAKLVKLPGLCTQMQFYSPGLESYPLKIEVNIGQGAYMLGTMKVFIKDTWQISYEQSLQENTQQEVSKEVVQKKKSTKKTN